MKHSLAKGLYAPPSRITVDEYLDDWLEKGAKGSSRTREGTRCLLAKYVRPRIGSKRLDQLAPLDLQSIVTAMEAGYSSRTLRMAIAALRRALDQAVRWRDSGAQPYRRR